MACKNALFSCAENYRDKFLLARLVLTEHTSAVCRANTLFAQPRPVIRGFSRIALLSCSNRVVPSVERLGQGPKLFRERGGPERRKGEESGGERRLLRQQPRLAPQPKPKNKIVKTLGTLWDTLTPEAKTEFQKAGYQPPKPKPEEPDLISLLQIHAKNLPEAVREALPPPAPIPEPDPVQDGLEKGNALRKAVMKLRDLGQRKLKLQGEIDASKTHLRELLKRLQSLQSDIAEATEAVKKRSQEYEPVLESADDEPNNVDLVLQALGLEEAALTDDQKRKIDALREGAKKRKLPDEADEDMKPPGLPVPAAVPQGGSSGPGNKPGEAPAQVETETEGANKARSRSRGRTSPQG